MSDMDIRRNALRLRQAGRSAVRAGRAWIGEELTPVEDVIVTVRNGVIESVTPHGAADPGCEVLDLRERTLAPGLINAHTHLELSHLEGTTTQGRGFPAWVGSLIAQDLGGLQAPSLEAALAVALEGGTAFMADIYNRKPGLVAAVAQALDLGLLQFAEFIGWPDDPPDLESWQGWNADWTPEDAASFGATLAAAGHSVHLASPELLQLARDWDEDRGLPFSLHLAEHPDEVEALVTGQGLFADMLRMRIVPPDWIEPGQRPVAWAESLGLLGPRTLAVHCVQLTDEDIAILAHTRTSVCLCPRSNAHIGVGRPRVRDLLDAGINVCLGTDSLASNADLDVRNEVLALREDYGLTDERTLLRMVTINAAKALGIADRFGSIAPGKAAVFRLD